MVLRISAGSDSRTAAESFRQAIARDSAWPLPHLGLGLSLIQDGDIAAGREELEIAVIHDPSNAVVRSYMAKAYELERRNELTETQLELAKDFDPADPTPHYYDSISKYNTNRPVEALHDLQAAAELDGQRLVHRSTLGVDEDLAARAAAPGLVYRDLGFEHTALLHGTKALAADPTDYSALQSSRQCVFGNAAPRNVARQRVVPVANAPAPEPDAGRPAARGSQSVYRR